MRGRSNRVAWALMLEAVPAATFAAALAYCAALVIPAPIPSPLPAVAGLAGLVIGWVGLRLFAGGPEPFPFPTFDASLFEPEEADPPAVEVATDLPELLLDEPIARPSEVDRVVNLFAATAMPTPGELHRRIERHLRGAPPARIPDATEALHEALAELRRSLR